MEFENIIESSSNLRSEFSFLGTICWVLRSAPQGKKVRAVRKRPSMDRSCNYRVSSSAALRRRQLRKIRQNVRPSQSRSKKRYQGWTQTRISLTRPLDKIAL